MSLHLHAVPQQGLLERLESTDPCTISNEALCYFAQRVSHLMGRVSNVSVGNERHALEEFEYGAECVVDHFTPVTPSAVEQIRHNQDVRRKMDYEEAA